MINITDGLKQFYVPQLNDVGQILPYNTNEWLTDASEYIIFQDLLTNDFSVQTFDQMIFLKPYAFDINRLSCAALESLRDIEVKVWQPKFLGWNITKFYYSAFFSAHSILKITGNSLSNIEISSLNSVRERARNYGYSYNNLNTGLYCTQFLPNNVIRFYKNGNYDNSHEGLWKSFYDFLVAASPLIYNVLPQSDALIIVDKLDELREALTEWNSQNGNWLSRVRNLVNYGQKYGTWYPYKNIPPDHVKIYSYSKLHLKNPLDISLIDVKGKDLSYFVKTCQLINSINFELLKDLETKHSSNKSFIKSGITKFQNLYP